LIAVRGLVGVLVSLVGRRLVFVPRVLCPATLTPASLFSFHADDGHRDLHSFPTRRSSDLSRGAGGADSRVARPFRRLGCRRGARDRKSTRLNSSHVKISYAVFCLKKKKTATSPPKTKRNADQTETATTHQAPRDSRNTQIP